MSLVFFFGVLSVPDVCRCLWCSWCSGVGVGGAPGAGASPCNLSQYYCILVFHCLFCQHYTIYVHALTYIFKALVASSGSVTA